MRRSPLQMTLAIVTVATVAAASHYFTRYYDSNMQPSKRPSESAAAREPDYWVAPMDPNYRRDKPGKSPMGMDLIPVYLEPEAAATTGPVTVRIDPAVVSNLGVRTARAFTAPLQQTLRTVGYVQYDQDRLLHIHPRVAGWIETLHVKAEGDTVSAGQPLYALYSPELVNAQEEFVLALNRNNSALIDAARERLQSLQLSGELITELHRTRNVQRTITFHAPQGGVVNALNIREGFHVQPGTTLMAIASLEQVWVEAEVLERQAGMVSTDMPVTMSLDYLPGRQWQGKVDYIYPSLDPQTRTLRLRLRFDNADGLLRPNMFVTVMLTQRSHDARVLVPRAAVIRTGVQDRVVLALGEGRFRSTAITRGGSDDAYVEVLDGIVAGDAVVISAQFLLDSESNKAAGLARLESPTEPLAEGAHPLHSTKAGAAQ